MAELSYQDKVATLHKLGFIRDQDRSNLRRIESRWRVYLTTPQKTARTAKGKADADPAS